jgi:hypothetical protein
MKRCKNNVLIKSNLAKDIKDVAFILPTILIYKYLKMDFLILRSVHPTI